MSTSLLLINLVTTLIMLFKEWKLALHLELAGFTYYSQADFLHLHFLKTWEVDVTIPLVPKVDV